MKATEREPVPGWDASAVAKPCRWAIPASAIGALFLPSPYGALCAILTLILIVRWVWSRLGR